MMKRTLSVIALGGLLLAGCSGGTTEVEGNGASASPMISTPIVSTGGDETVSVPSLTSPEEPPMSEIPTEPSATSTLPAPQGSAEPPNPLEPGPTTEVEARSSPPNSGSPAQPGGTWVSMDVTVTTGAEAKNLTQTSPDFQAFVATRVDTPDASGCESELTVQAFHPDGYAAGQDFAAGCGSSQNIWGKVGGKWETLMAMQSVVECTEMKVNNIPKGIPELPCLDANGNLTDW